MLRLLRPVGVVGSILFAFPSIAGSVDTPRCHVDLAEADRLIHGIRLRENRCNRATDRLLRRNLRDMSEARRLMNPCLTAMIRAKTSVRSTPRSGISDTSSIRGAFDPF
jgi:hypothetical protein